MTKRKRNETSEQKEDAEARAREAESQALLNILNGRVPAAKRRRAKQRWEQSLGLLEWEDTTDHTGSASSDSQSTAQASSPASGPADQTSQASTPTSQPAYTAEQVRNVPAPVAQPIPSGPSKRFEKPATYDVPEEEVRELLREGGARLKPLPDDWILIQDAVPPDSMLPPGVPLSEAERAAFYPNHIVWEAVQERLKRNMYRADHIAGMQTFFRGRDIDTLDKIRKHLRRTPKNTMAPTRDLRLLLAPKEGSRISKRKLTVPTYRDLVKGLKHLPSGHDRRALTVCVEYWLEHQDEELDVLDTVELFGRLNERLSLTGPMNTDRVLLEEWRESRTLTMKAIPEEIQVRGSEEAEEDEEVEGEMRIGDSDDEGDAGMDEGQSVGDDYP